MEQSDIENISNNVSKKERWNAKVAYLMIFFSGLLLFNKQINTLFVKWHIKSSMLIHLWFLITYIIFISNWLFRGINIFWIWLNNIITSLIFLILLLILLIWIYKANKWLTFNISKWINIYKQEKILDLNWDWQISEKEKLTILLSFVPFIWFLLFWRYKDNAIIQTSTRTNIIISLTISLLFIFWHWSLASIFLLVYTIVITFIWINLFSRDELLQIKLPEILSPEKGYIWFIALKDYLIWYIKDNWFKSFSETHKNISDKIKNSEKETLKLLEEKKDFRFPKILLYIPIVNLITIFKKNTKYSVHKANWLMITVLMIIGLILSYFWYITYKINILYLFPILFSIWYLNNRLAYKIPIIYNIYELFIKIFWLLKWWTKKINDKRKEENEVTLKVKNIEALESEEEEVVNNNIPN